MSYQTNAMEKVMDFITEKIRSREWSYGDKIWTEAELCNHLNVSRVTVRHAIEKFVTMSILRKVQGSGTYVENADKLSIMSMPMLDFSPEDMLSLLYFRLYFESGNVKLFIKNADEQDLRDLEETVKELNANTNTPEQYYHYDYKYHNIIAKGTKNPIISKISELIAESMEQNQQSIYRIVHPVIGHEDHNNIFRYIKEKNVEFARIVIQNHIVKIIDVIENLSNIKK
jgi:GntR family transcriptional regulator, transcriptional repressor for pyruvate dehydrogenase complex